MEITRQAIEANPNPIYVKDQNGKFILANSAFAQLHGISVENLLKKGALDSDYSQDRDLTIIQSGEETLFEEFYKLKTGSEVWFNTTKKVFQTADDSRYLLSVSADITILKTALQLAEEDNKQEKIEQGKLYTEISTSIDAILGIAKLIQKGISNQEANSEYIKTIVSIAEALMATLPSGFLKTNELPKENEPRVLNQLEGLSILLVEDDPANQLLAVAHLESWKIKVDLAVNGEEALVKTKENAYDLILMDIQMPGIDGIEATTIIRNEDNLNSGTPIIAFTANLLSLEAQDYQKYGFSDTLFKPYHVSSLYQVVSKNIGKPYSQTFSDLSKESDKPLLYDFSGLGNLSEDDLFIQKMKKLFIDMVPKQLEQIATSVRLNEWEEVAHLAHRLKSTYGNIKVIDAAEAMKKIEEMARSKKNLDQVITLLHLANETTDKVISHFMQEKA